MTSDMTSEMTFNMTYEIALTFGPITNGQHLT